MRRPLARRRSRRRSTCFDAFDGLRRAAAATAQPRAATPRSRSARRSARRWSTCSCPRRATSSCRGSCATALRARGRRPRDVAPGARRRGARSRRRSAASCASPRAATCATRAASAGASRATSSVLGARGRATACCARRPTPTRSARVWAALTCPTSGDVLLSAAPGYEFVDWGGVDHVGGGSHGSLHASDSLGALAFCVRRRAGADDREAAGRSRRRPDGASRTSASPADAQRASRPRSPAALRARALALAGGAAAGDRATTVRADLERRSERPVEPRPPAARAPADRPPGARDRRAVPKVRARAQRAHPGLVRQRLPEGRRPLAGLASSPARAGRARRSRQVYIDDATGRVHRGVDRLQVAWTMARGYPGAFGRKVNAL